MNILNLFVNVSGLSGLGVVYQSLLDNGSWVPSNSDKGAAPQVFMTQADVEGLL